MRLLVICENILPQRGISTIRWTKISKYLKINNGDKISIDILTTKKNYDDKNSYIPLSGKDELLEKDRVYFDEYYDIKIEKGLKLVYTLRKRSVGEDGKFVSDIDNVEGGFKTSVRRVLRKGFASYYSFLASHYAFKNMEEKANQYDAIISTYDPIWPHIVASKLKKVNSRIVWLADFRDPCGLCRNDLPGIAKWHKPVMKIIGKRANAALKVADFVYTAMPKKVEQIVVSNGYDPSENIEPIAPDKFSLVFTGTIYGRQRDFGIVFRALNDLCNAGLIEKTKVAVVYAGTNSAEAKLFAKENDGLDMLLDRGLVPRVESKALQASAAILIQASYNVKNDESLWTGKMFEYMSSRKPIIYVVNGDVPYSIPSKYIGKIGGVCYESARHDETYEELKAYILEKYNEWISIGNVTISRDEEYVEQFSHKKIAEQVWSILNRFKN